jgi:glutamate synthase (NADPH/NADH) small chain
MEKAVLDRRLAQLRAERVIFRTGVDIGSDIAATELRESHDAVVLAVGATQWRELPVPGRGLDGVHQAMDYLPPANRVCAGDIPESPLSAAGRHVVVIGGGDTGADCVGTAHRQGALSVTQLEILPRPPESRPAGQPWPTYPMLFRVSSAHEEGGERVYGVATQEFLGDEAGRVRGLRLVTAGAHFTPIDGTSASFAPISSCWRWASSVRSGDRCSPTSGSHTTSAARSRGTRTSRPMCLVSSSPGTPAAVSRWSSGLLPKVAQQPPLLTDT